LAFYQRLQEGLSVCEIFTHPWGFSIFIPVDYIRSWTKEML